MMISILALAPSAKGVRELGDSENRNLSNTKRELGKDWMPEVIGDNLLVDFDSL